ncbi:MAG: molybdopterin-binding protein [Armatimonadaceae bacterium]
MNEKTNEPEKKQTDESVPNEPMEKTSPALFPDVPGETVVATGEEAEEAMRRMSRRSLLWAGAATVGTIGGMWAFHRFAPEDGTGIKQVFRTTHQINEAVAQSVFFSQTHRDREFPRRRARKPRSNYKGATPMMALEQWQLNLSGGTNGDQVWTLDDLRTLPEVSQTTELKCVEGWSAIVHWTGVRFRDFAEKYGIPNDAEYVSLRSEPPGYEAEWYYVGMDRASMLHPQTLLVYAMNDEPLTPDHGFPLRLVIPHKYGIKNIKLITHIAFSPQRTADYWADRGYDWYSGL